MNFSDELIKAIITYNDYRLHHEPYKSDPNTNLINELAQAATRSLEAEELHTKLLKEHETILAFNKDIDTRLKNYLEDVRNLLKKMLVGKVICHNSGNTNFVSNDMEYLLVKDIALNENTDGAIAVGPMMRLKTRSYKKLDGDSRDYIRSEQNISYDAAMFIKIIHITSCYTKDDIKKELQESDVRLTNMGEFEEVFTKLRTNVVNDLEEMERRFKETSDG